MKTVDVILLTYNAEKFIEDTLASILRNSYENFRVIIIDDNSSDQTVSIINGIMERNNGIIDLHVNKDNIGVTANTNKALMLSASDIIMFCGHDDLFYENKIQKCVDAFVDDPLATLVYHDCDVLVNGRFLMKYSDTHTPQMGSASKYLIHGCFSTGSSVCVNGELARTIKFNERIKNTSDFLFFYEIGKLGAIKYVPEVLGAYVRHESNLTSVLNGKEDFDSIAVSLYILEHYREDRVKAIINLNWTLIKLFSRNFFHLMFYLFSPIISLIWILGQKFGKEKIR